MNQHPTARLTNVASGVAVLVCTLNEEGGIEATLRSLRDQEVHPELLVLVDSHSKDRTVDIARRYVDLVMLVPRGKLTATDTAIRGLPTHIHTLVFTDGDTYYPPHWLRTLLAPFASPHVVMTHGPSGVNRPKHLIADLVLTGYDALVAANIVTAGRNRAIRRTIYEQVPFNPLLGPDLQKNLFLIWPEEEVLFNARVRQLGNIVLVPEAWCYTSDRRGDFDSQHWQEARAGERF